MDFPVPGERIEEKEKDKIDIKTWEGVTEDMEC